MGSSWVDDKGYHRMGPLYLHRVIYMNSVGPLPEDYDVHHIDHNKSNNLPYNLIAMPHWVHLLLHEQMRKENWIFDRLELEKRIAETMQRVSQLERDLFLLKGRFLSKDGKKRRFIDEYERFGKFRDKIKKKV